MDGTLHGQPTALVIDDDVCVRDMLAELLSEEGFQVVQASNGFSGLRLAAEHHPLLILLDLALPELSGMDVLRELRGAQATAETAVVIVTANPSRLTERQNVDADGVVLKPFDLNVLLAAMQLALDRAASRHAGVPAIAATAPITSGHDRYARTRRGAAHQTRGRRY